MPVVQNPWAESVTDASAREFLRRYFAIRQANASYVAALSEEQLDVRMGAGERKSPSGREKLAHLIRVQHEYLDAVEKGKLEFGVRRAEEEQMCRLTKRALLDELKAADEWLVRLLSDEANVKKAIQLSWKAESVEALTLLRGLHDYECLHMGWMLALLGFLGLELPEVQKTWVPTVPVALHPGLVKGAWIR